MTAYTWEARYRDSRRLRTHSPGGPWHEATLPLEGLIELIVLGHPAGPLRVPAPVDLAGVVLRVRGRLTLGGRGPAHRQRWLFGMRGAEGGVQGWRIDETGRPAWYVGPEEAW